MSGFWRSLLGVDSIPAASEGVQLGFEHPLPPWGWALAIAASATLAWLAYRRLSGPVAARAALASIRGCFLMLLVVLLAAPELVLPRERVERDRVALLIDRSESLLVTDAIADASGVRETREAQLRTALSQSVESIAEIGGGHDLFWLGFHADAFPLPVDATVPEASLGEPTGTRTRLARALGAALDAAEGRPLAAIVVASDGRSADAIDRGLLRRLEDSGAAVFAIPLGSAEPLGDLAIAEVEAPTQAFVDDEIPILVTLASSGAPPRGPVEVRLVDEATSDELASRTIDPSRIGEAVVLTTRSDEAGSRRWRVEVDAGEADLLAANDRRGFEIGLIDRPLRVLYIDGYPRWEYRYLKNLLVREDSIESSVMLLSADRDFAQEGNLPLARLPRSPEEFAAYDLVVLGDVPAGFFSPEQLEMLRELVSSRGAGLLLLAGPRYAPRAWAGTPLEEMLPFSGPLSLPTIDRDVSMRPSLLAAREGLLGGPSAADETSGWPIEVSDPEARWAKLRWAQEIDPERLKPAAETIAETIEGDPLLVRMRYGAGQVVYLATDETWRWRYGRGETLQERFWIPLLRLLGRDAIASSGEAISLRVSPGRIAMGERATIELELSDARAIEIDLPAAAVKIERNGESEGERSLPRTAVGLHAAAWEPSVTGLHRIELTEPDLVRLAGGRVFAEVEVVRPDDEWRRPESDHATLSEIASATGGGMVEPTAEGLRSLPERIPDRSVIVPIPIRESIWASPLALGLAVVLLGVEWVGRRLLKFA